MTGDLAIKLRPPSQMGASPAAVYGSMVYTYDSNLWTAAVHAGIWPKTPRGRIMVKMVESPQVFKGSTQNGIKSEVWASPSNAAYQLTSVK